MLLLALVLGELAAVLQEQPLVPGLGAPGVGLPVELEAPLGRKGGPHRASGCRGRWG